MKDIERFEVLYRDSCPILTRYITRNLLINGELPAITPEDLTQRVYTVAWQKRERVMNLENPTGWLIECAKRVYLSLLRDEKKWSANVELIGDIQHSSNFQEQIELKVLMEDKDFYVLKRHYGEGASYEELCSELQIGKSALAMRIKRAKERLRELMEL